jgi:hypothetical protein
MSSAPTPVPSMPSAPTPVPPHALPNWMRRSRQGIDWGLLLALLLGLIAAFPFIFQAGLPRTNASEVYVWRGHDTADALREGRLYPRWSPHALGGYGAPIPHYTPPLPAYLAALVELLFSNNPVTSVRIVYVLAFLLASGGMYAVVLRRAGAVAGLIAAVVYVYSPHVLLNVPHAQGDLAQMLALALVPLLLWSAERLSSINRAVDWLMVGMFGAALLLTSPPHFFAGAALCVVLVLDRGWRAMLWLGVWLLVGGGIAAFYWLPAWVERDLVQWTASPISIAPPIVSWQTVLALVQPIDAGTLLVQPQFTIGLAGILTSVMVVITLWRYPQDPNRGLWARFLVVACACVVAVCLWWPAETWLMGVLACCLALASGALAQWRNREGALVVTANRPTARLYLPLTLLMLLAASYPQWVAPTWDAQFGEYSPLSQLRHEQEGFGVAVLPLGAPVPRTIPLGVMPSGTLLQGYETDNLNRIAPGQPSNTLQITVLRASGHSTVLQVDVLQTSQLQLLTAYFAGWQADMDGAVLAVSPNNITQLLNVALPSGQGTLTLTLGPTLIRLLAWGVSAVALWAMLWAMARRLRRQDDLYEDVQLLALPEARLTTLLVVGFASFLMVFALAWSPLPLRPTAGYGLDGAQGLRWGSDQGLQALAYRLPDAVVDAQGEVRVTLYWRAVRRLENNYQGRILLVSADGSTTVAGPLQTLGNYPARRWLTTRGVQDVYIEDVYRLPLRGTLPAGAYRVAVEVFTCAPSCADGARVNFFDDGGQPLGGGILLPQDVVIVD